jgi:hypothetical protein
LTKAIFAPVELVSADGDVLTLAAPNPVHQARCEQEMAAVERALRDATGRAITVQWGSASTAADSSTSKRPHAPIAADEAASHVDDLDVPDESRPVLSGGPSVLERLSEAFPGATLVGEDD